LNTQVLKFYHRIVLGLFVIAMSIGSSAVSGEAALQFHCAGVSQLENDKGLTSLQKIFALRATTNFGHIALTRFSNLLTNSLRLANTSPSLIEPLLSDVFEKESLGSISGAFENKPGFILALRPDAWRMQLWQDNLAKIFGHDGEKFASGELTGLRWVWNGSNALWIIPARDWLLVGAGDGFSTVQTEYLERIKTQGRPSPPLKNWLEADIDSAHMGGWFQLLKPARIRITIAPSTDDLQINAQMIDTESISWKPEPWQIPEGLARGRIISFTAGQNVAAFLNVNPPYSQLPGNPLTNQFYFWALDQMPLLNYMAWPTAHASNVLQSLSTEAPAVLNPMLQRFNGTKLVWRPEASQLIWMNMNWFSPFLRVEKDNDTQYLVLSSFPLSESDPMPDSITSRLQSRTNLVYYDWEKTGPRLRQWQMLSKMIANRAFKETKEIIENAQVENGWLGALSYLPGETQTEIARTGPNELSLERKGPIGFTAVELAWLADWICDLDSGPIHPPLPAAKKGPGSPPAHR
jgi:hypothetical protein